MNLPVKSCDVPVKVTRKLPATRTDAPETQKPASCYTDFDSLLSAVGKMKLNEWNFVKRDGATGQSAVFRLKKNVWAWSRDPRSQATGKLEFLGPDLILFLYGPYFWDVSKFGPQTLFWGSAERNSNLR